MALVTCPECSAHVSAAAGACAKCGYPFRSAGVVQRTSGLGAIKGVATLMVLAGLVGIIVVKAGEPNRPAAAGCLCVLVVGFVLFVVARFRE